MSQRRRKTHSSREIFSQPQPSTSRENATLMEEDDGPSTQPQNKSMTGEELAHHVANTVKYILAADQTKVPINKALIPKGIAFQGRNFKTVLHYAEKYLDDVFGFESIDDHGKLILINKINNEHLKFEEDVSNKYVLLFLCLSHIYMSGQICTEGSLEGFLKRLGIIDEDEPTKKNEYFGSVMDVIKGDFVKEKYLEIVKRDPKDNAENLQTEFVWGIRAKKELPVRRVMEFISKIYERDMTSWPQQYDKMLKSENQSNSRENRENEMETQPSQNTSHFSQRANRSSQRRTILYDE